MLRPFLKVLLVAFALLMCDKQNVEPTLVLAAFFIAEFEWIHQRLEAKK